MLPMDGYHLSRAELRAMPDPDLAFRRRGAHFTFDAARYHRDLAALRSTGRLSAPDFDHAEGDPKEDAFVVDATKSAAGRHVVIVEGLYTLLRGLPHWEEASHLFDFRIYLRCPLDVSTERLVRRHMAAWGISREAALERASGSDAENSRLVATTEGGADLVIDTSTDDPSLLSSSQHTVSVV